MLTILAWITFVPALIWNIAFFIILVIDFFDVKSKGYWKFPVNYLHSVLSLFFLLIPGIYLFGVW